MSGSNGSGNGNGHGPTGNGGTAAQAVSAPEVASAPEAVGAVLVCGAGITGIQASLDLAESGFKVYLVDSTAAIGGRMAQLDKTFPTGDCAMCILSPKLVECARNKNIEIITLADVQGISGEPGNFKVKVRQNPRYVDLNKCNACGDCTDACPVDLPSEFDRRLGTRKAIFRPYPQAIPNVFGISKAEGRAPCKSSCPAGVNAQGYVALVAAGKFGEAYELVRERCPLPSACGRVCQHPCEDDCNRGEVDQPIAVRDLKRFVGDYIDANPDKYPPAKPAAAKQDANVAIVGGGPAGLTAAYDLAMLGYGVTVFEAQPHLGGMLRYGIPSYRLSNDVLDQEIQHILDLGVEAKTDTRVADPASLLESGFRAVFAAPGAWVSRKLGIAGEDNPSVLEGIEFLRRVNSGETPDSRRERAGHRWGRRGHGRCALRAPAARSLLGPSGLPREPGGDAGPFLGGGRSARGRRRLPQQPGADRRRDRRRQGDRRDVPRLHQCVRRAGAVRPPVRRFQDRRPFCRHGDRHDRPGYRRGRAGRGHRARGADRGGRRHPRDEYSRGVRRWRRGAGTGGHGRRDGPGPQGRRGYRRIPARGQDVSGLQHDGGRCGPRRERWRGAGPNGPESPARRAQAGPGQDAPGRPGRVACAASPRSTRVTAAEQAIAEAKRCLACGLCSECMQCVKACTAGAVWHDQPPEEIEIDAGSVILTPGFEEFQGALRGEFGHGRYANVLSSVQFERMLSAAGPTAGHVQRPSDGGEVERIAFIQCVGSRDVARGNGYCSSICCMSATKEAMVALEHAHGKQLDVSIFCMDVRAFGKEFDSYVNRARDEHGVKYIRAIPSRVVEMPGTKNPRVRYFDDAGVEQQQEYDLVVLSVGLQVPQSVRETAGRLGLDLNEFGFAQTERLAPLATSRPGLYVAGAFQEPKDIPESVAQASAAAACAMDQLAPARGSLIKRQEYPWERDVTDEAPRIGVFICHCGQNISSVIDVQQVADKAALLPNVVYAETSLYTCSDTNLQHVKDAIKKHRLNRLVVASCSPRTHEVLFQETLRDSGLNQYLFAMANIRDQGSWVHKDDPVAATEKAGDLMAMAVARARHLKGLQTGQLPVTASALILGGGLAGMTAALGIADQGFQVHLVEKEPALGGLLRERPQHSRRGRRRGASPRPGREGPGSSRHRRLPERDAGEHHRPHRQLQERHQGGRQWGRR